MLKTSGSTEATTRPGKGGVGAGVDNGGDGGNDGGHINEYSPRSSRRVHQRTHQLVWPRLGSSMMRLIKVGAVLLAGWSKSCQKVEESSKSPKKPQRSEKFAKAIALEERLLKHRSSINEKLELPLKF